VEEEWKASILQVIEERGRPTTKTEPLDPLIGNGLLDSLSLLEFVAFLERRFKIKIPGNDIVPENVESLSAITSYLRSRLQSGSER
jgi:acyl carrier protein